MSLSCRIRRSVFGIAPVETTFARRGFPAAQPEKQAHLEQIGGQFVVGYNAALETADAAPLTARLDQVEPEFTGFAYEGAAMALAILDAVIPWGRSRFGALAAGGGADHTYMMHVGAGWAAARIPWLRRNLMRHVARFDPLLKWLAVDGFGFHQGYFHWREFIGERKRPGRLSGYARRAFDQGLGRSMWFVLGGDVDRIGKAILSYDPERRDDLVSGVGLACAYAGGVSDDEVARLADLAGEHRPWLAQGVAFAAKARGRAGNMVAHTELACRLVCGTTAERAAAVTDDAQVDLPWDSGDEDVPAFEHWRRRIAQAWASDDADARSPWTVGSLVEK